MGKVRFQLAVSLDGYVAGPDQSEEPLEVGGMALHEWVYELEAWRRQQGMAGGIVNAGTQVVEEAQTNVGSTVMGRNMFGGGPGPWPSDPPWNGWWGEEPGDADVMIGGGASTVQQYFDAGMVDEFELHLVPIMLGAGERLFENVGRLDLEQIRAIEAPGVTHLTYRLHG